MFIIRDLAKQVKILDIINAIAIFIRGSRQKIRGKIASNYNIDRRERDPS
jgi:hypothetical protein